MPQSTQHIAHDRPPDVPLSTRTNLWSERAAPKDQGRVYLSARARSRSRKIVIVLRGMQIVSRVECEPCLPDARWKVAIACQAMSEQARSAPAARQKPHQEERTSTGVQASAGARPLDPRSQSRPPMFTAPLKTGTQEAQT